LPTSTIRARLRKIEEQRTRLKQHELEVDAQLAEGAAHIDGCLKLMEDPAELYRHASDETRRQLNQAIFKRLYVYNDAVTGHEMNEPLAELLALEAGDRALQATGSQSVAVEAAEQAFDRHAPERSKAALKGGLACFDAVLTAVTSPNGSSNDRLVACSRNVYDVRKRGARDAVSTGSSEEPPHEPHSKQGCLPPSPDLISYAAAPG